MGHMRQPAGDQDYRRPQDHHHRGMQQRCASQSLAWLDRQLKGCQDASKMFLEEESRLNCDPQWIIETKNFRP